MILRNTNRLETLIGDILDLSKMQAGKFKLNPRKSSIKNTVEKVVDSMAPFAERKRIQIKTKIPSLPDIKMDDNRIEQVLTNLLDNAIKFTPKKGAITISAQKRKKDFLVRVKDNGIGVSKKDIERIFRPFVQVAPSYVKKHQGTGLGLTISRIIIEQHSGRIWARSKPKQGTTIYFTLPLRFVERKKKNIFGGVEEKS